LAAIEGEKDYFPLGEVPLEWLQKRILGIATAEGEYADICSSEWISRLPKSLAAHLSKFGIEDIDAAVLQKTAPRSRRSLYRASSFTQASLGFTTCRSVGTTSRTGLYLNLFKSM
jgi:hypothetical protein